jgi:hypothetical protein
VAVAGAVAVAVAAVAAVPTTTITSIVCHIPKAHAATSCTIHYPLSKFSIYKYDGNPVIPDYLPRLSKVG